MMRTFRDFDMMHRHTSVSKSGSSTYPSSTTTTVPAAPSTGFYIVPSKGYYVKVATGANAPATYSTQAAATKFQLDSTTGYLIQANGNNVGYAASMPQGVSVNQKLLWNPTGTASNNYVKCSIDENNGWLVCSAGGQFQQAYACQSDSYSSLYFGPNIPSGCSWIGLFRQSTTI